MIFKEHFRKILLTRFLEELETENRTSGFVCAVKRLSGNDTGLTGSHQAGLYLPKEFFRQALPKIHTTSVYNPEAAISECYIASHDVGLPATLRAIYYNSKACTEAGRGQGTRNEFRITRWGGKDNPLQDESNTGCLVVFALAEVESQYKAVVWLSESDAEDNIIEDWVGTSITGKSVAIKKRQQLFPTESHLPQLPEEWIKSEAYPTAKEIFSFVEGRIPYQPASDIDHLLLERRELEFSVFQALETQRLLPKSKGGFTSVDDFTGEAKSVINRRKSRSGASLELHLSSIFTSCGLQFEEQVKTEGNKQPDFIFPSGKAYHDPMFPISKMTFLASKTCCKDRWRQILNEADRFKDRGKFLFTLQEGISTRQLDEMHQELVSLVVPKPNIKTFRPSTPDIHIRGLSDFVELVREQQR